MCACVCVRVVACAVTALIEGAGDCFQFDIKVQDIAKCRSGLSEHFSKVRKFFSSLSLLFSFFPAHTMSPQAQLSVRLCVCVSLIYLCLFLRLSHKMSSQKLRAENFSFVVVLSTVGDLSNCFSFLESRFAFV